VAPPDGFTTARLLDRLEALDPRGVALVGGAGATTLGRLLADARRVAAAVTARVPAGRPVAVLAPQDAAGIAAILGCLMSGRLAMLLTVNDPPARTAAILADAAPAALLAPAAVAGMPHLGLAAVLAGPDAAGWRADAAHDPDAAAVVHFTSGSSGTPKGIVLPLRAVLYRTWSTFDDLCLRPGDALLAATLPAMGSGLAFLLASLLTGARYLTVNLAQEGATALLALAREAPADVAVIAPPILRMLCRLGGAPAAFAGLRMLRTGAAGLAQADLDLFRSVVPAGCAISHTYASTEALIAAQWVVPPGYLAPGPLVPVGVPAADHHYRLLNPDGQPVAPGEIGEYVASSRHMAIGEWQGGTLVAGRMPPDPLHPGRRLFRTGDLLRLQPDGMLHFAGRVDRQVKINGARIEPTETEAVLRTAAGVQDAIVLAITGPNGITLHGFVAAPDSDPDTLRPHLQALLREHLPAALRPTRLTILPALPSLPGGKTDVRALRGLE
jgi:non-ribosomal peptide synthetase component F